MLTLNEALKAAGLPIQEASADNLIDKMLQRVDNMHNGLESLKGSDVDKAQVSEVSKALKELEAEIKKLKGKL